MKKRLLVLLAALVVMSYGLAYAQTGTVKIDFPFVANGKTLQPGTYTVTMPNDNAVAFNGPGGKAVMIVMTQLGRHDQDTDLEVVFDIVDGKYLLSEVWFPEHDGFLLLSTKQAHKHAVVGGSNPHK
jgi:type 1 fimbria pilin